MNSPLLSVLQKIRKFKTWPTRFVRTMDGRCNNLYNIYWGSALSPYWRFAPARYADDLQKPFGNDLHVVQSCCSIGLAMKDLPHRLSSEQSLSEHNVYLCVGNYNFTIVDFISLTN